MQERREGNDPKLSCLLGLPVYLLPWQAWLVGAQGMAAGLGSWENRMSGEESWR